MSNAENNDIMRNNSNKLEEKEKHKPITLLARELENDITFVINNCRVPPFIIVMVLKIILNKVENISNAQYARDMEQYNDYCNE